MHEFELIEHFFSDGGTQRQDVLLGVGDDAALLQVPPGRKVVTAIATVQDPDKKQPPESLGEQVLALSLQRLRAAGATPAWVTLALTLPEFDRDWLECFSRTLRDLAHSSGVALIGGDTTRGPLSVTVVSNGYG